MSNKIIYSRGFPYGAPLVMLRGGATKLPEVKEFIKAQGFSWDGSAHAWTHYMHKYEFGKILAKLRDMGCEVEPKDTIDPNYVIDLDEFPPEPTETMN